MRFLYLAFILLLPFSLSAKIEFIKIANVEFAYRLPKTIDANTRIMVLFGGRNWQGQKALTAFNFNELADKYSLILISPSFKDRDYWQPEKWSGKVLKSAIKSLEKSYQLKPQKLLFYGYSAGGQCSNLFYNYMPKDVEAWGLHACGVYPETPTKNGVKAFITCGLQDSDRVRISKSFIYKYRENGGKVIWKEYLGGHELNKEALIFAYQFFTDILENKPDLYVADDDSKQILPLKKTSEIDVEFRNYLSSEQLKNLWKE